MVTEVPAPDRLELRCEVAQLYGDPRLSPLLRRLVSRSSALVGAVAGSISFVERSSGRYTKIAEVGASCQLGRSFPIDEGITGQVIRHRRPVALSSYRQVRSGHLKADSAAARGSVAAVPIWWRGDVIGVNVVFAGRRHAFAAGELDALEMLTQLAAPGIVQAGASDPLLSRLLRERPRSDSTAGVSTVITEIGDARPVPPPIAELAMGLVALAERAAGRGNTPASLHVAILHRPEGLRLIVQDEHVDAGDRPSPADLLRDSTLLRWRDIVGVSGGAIQVREVPGWGTLLHADLPYPRAMTTPPGSGPFTPREREVLELLGKGMSDRAIAKALVLSSKTVEKYVGAVLRKSGVHSRTAAVLTAFDRGWLPVPDHGVGR